MKWKKITLKLKLKKTTILKKEPMKILATKKKFCLKIKNVIGSNPLNDFHTLIFFV